MGSKDVPRVALFVAAFMTVFTAAKKILPAGLR